MGRVCCALVLLLGLGGATRLSAQEVGRDVVEPGVVGRVVDERGAALGRALVSVEGSGRAVETDASGRFLLRNLPAGRHRLRISLLGYAPAVREVEVSSEGREAVPGAAGSRGEVASRPVELVIMLSSTPLALPGLQVTGTAAGRDPLALTQSTIQLGGRHLERELGGTLAETLRSQPGLAVRYNGPAAAAPVVRGLTGDRVLVLQDGQRTADLSGSADDHGVTIDPLSAQRIEVVRGPATLLYGNNALGGVVNVISGDLPSTLPSRGAWVLGAQTESAYPGVSGSARATLPLGGAWVLSARGGGRVAGDVRIGRDPVSGDRLENTGQRSANAAVGVGHVGERVVAGGAARYYGFGYGLPVPPGTEPVRIRGWRREGSGRAEWGLSSPLFPTLRVEGTVQGYEHDEVDVPTGAVLQSFALRTRTLGLTLRQGRLGPIAEGAWGISSLFKDNAATGPAALTPAALSRAIGIFGFQELELTEAGPALQVGGRYDVFRIEARASEKFGRGRANDYRAFSGSIGLRIPLGEEVSVGVSHARSFRAPTVEELFSGSYHAGTGTVEFGDPGLRAERGRGLEGVLRVQGARLNGQLAVYRNAIDDYIYLAARGDTLLDGAAVAVLGYAQDRATLAGIEGSLELAATPRLVLAVMGDLVRASLRDGTPLSYMPPPRLGAELRWDDDTYSLGWQLHHEFRQDRTGLADELPTDAHTLHRASAGVRRRTGKVTHSLVLRGDNLANRPHREATSRIKEFAPNPGRNVSLAYRIYW
jgi:iron complex outermembrane receptor protein